MTLLISEESLNDDTVTIHVHYMHYGSLNTMIHILSKE